MRTETSLDSRNGAVVSPAAVGTDRAGHVCCVVVLLTDGEGLNRYGG
jgi:hypothetical protein